MFESTKYDIQERGSAGRVDGNGSDGKQLKGLTNSDFCDTDPLAATFQQYLLH